MGSESGCTCSIQWVVNKQSMLYRSNDTLHNSRRDANKQKSPSSVNISSYSVPITHDVLREVSVTWSCRCGLVKEEQEMYTCTMLYPRLATCSRQRMINHQLYILVNYSSVITEKLLTRTSFGQPAVEWLCVSSAETIFAISTSVTA